MYEGNMKKLLGILLLVSTVALADDVYYWVEKSKSDNLSPALSSREGEKPVESPQKPKVTYLNNSQDTVRVIIKRS